MIATTLLSICLAAGGSTECIEALLVETTLPGLFSVSAMNDSAACTGMLDGSTERMVVWSDGDIVTQVTSFPESYGVLINENGQAAGLGSTGIFQDDRLVRADIEGNFEILASISGSEGWSSLAAMNEQGSIVGNYSGGSGSSTWQAFAWSDDAGLEFIEPDATSSYVRDIDENNRVIGYALYESNYHAFIWEDGVVTDLADLLGLGGNSVAWRFDDAGRMLVSEHPAGGASYYWFNPGDASLEEIHTFPSGSYSLRNVVSSNGLVAFSWTNTSNEPLAARWTPANGLEYIEMNEDIVGFTVTGINGNGRVIGTAFLLPFYEQVAMFCGDDLVLEDLEVHTGSNPLTSIAIDINDNDQVLLRGDYEYWILSARCEGDVDGDGAVDVNDLLLVISSWGTDGGGDCGPDTDGSGVVDVNDLLTVISAWGSCP